MALDERAERAPEGEDPRQVATWVAACTLLAAMIGISVWGANVIPASARVPIHFDLHGRADGFGSRWVALLALPIVAANVLCVMYACRRLVRGSGRALAATAAGATALQTALHALLVLSAAGHRVDFGLGASLAEGLLMMIVGNYLPTTRPNGLIGIRTPWTLNSEEVWRRTHALGGRLFFALGVLVLCATLISPRAAKIVLLVGVVALALGALVYSQRLARKSGGTGPAQT